MKVSELIAELANVITEHGDVDVYLYHERGGYNEEVDSLRKLIVPYSTEDKVYGIVVQ